jgi:predicted RND superfamily exporter protein
MNNYASRWLSRYVDFVSRHIVMALLVIAATTAATFILSSKLSIKGDLKELLPDNYPSVIALNRALERIGGVGSLIVTVESPDVEANKRFMDALAGKLNALPEGTLRYLDYKSEDIRRFYEKYALYYLEPTDIDELYDATQRKIDSEKLTRLKLAINFGADDPLESKIDEIRRRNEKNNAGPIKTFEDYYGENNGQFLIMLIRPYENSLSAEAARRMIAVVEDQVAQVNPTQFDPAMKVGYCGNVKSSVEEYDTLKKDILSTTLLCITLIGLSIALFFMRLRVVFLLGATLLIALSWTFAITELTIGYLNSQTAFLGSIILGTGINYGIIVMARYIEECRRGLSPTPAMQKALTHTMKATFLAAAAPAVSFLVLLVAKIKGLNQFGLIGAYGIMLCWLATMTILPVLTLATERIRRMVAPGKMATHYMGAYRRFAQWITEKPVQIVTASTILTIASIILMTVFASDAIEYDFTKLRNKTSVASGTEALERRVSKLFNDSMTPSVVVVDQMADAGLVCDAIAQKNMALPENERRVGSCRSIYSLVPKDQSEKLPKIARIAGLVHDNEKYIDRLDPKLKERVDSLRGSFSGQVLGLKDIPPDLTKHFEDLKHQPGSVVFISPRAGMLLSDGRNLVRFADTIRDFTLPDGRVMHAAGSSLVFADLVAAIQREAPVLTLTSLLCVLLSVALLIRRWRTSWVIVLSVVIGVITMLGLVALFKIKLNFFNFIALPLTFGVGADYVINMVLRLSKDRLTGLEQAFRHTGVAVVLCSLTTVIGYAVLIAANNQALASFGVLAIIGEVTCLLVAILLAPALLICVHNRRATHSETNEEYTSLGAKIALSENK